jgi:N-acetylmuramoyl-L-alanine amidase
LTTTTTVVVTTTGRPPTTVRSRPRPRPTTTTRPAPKSRPPLGPGLAGKVIAIDPGHNGGNGSHPAEINRKVDAGGFQKECDTTGTATNAGYTEAAYTFDVATRLAGVLRAAGATVVLTRPSNDGVGPCIDRRAGIGNEANADAAISIHADGGPASGRGFHVIEPALVKGYTEPIVEPSALLGTAIRDAFRDGTGMPYSTYAGLAAISVRGDLGGLNRSHVPKVFIETGNMRNATDAGLLTDAGFRQQAAEAMAAGLANFFT